MSRESYDALPYPAQPFAPSHPRNLESIATLLGLTPRAITNARVLELGCGTGGNLIPMAATMPGATFVGIDYSPVQIEQARRFVDALALKNITFEALSILDVTPDYGKYDYIIAHGLLSWVPMDVQAKTFDVMRTNLSANGVAYVSFNVFPGWHARQSMREMMSFHAPAIDGQPAADRVTRAREICQIVAESPDIKDTPAGAILKREMEQWVNRPPQYVVHEYLDEANRPFYIHDFIAQAKSHGLQYLADAQNNAVLFETGKLLDEAKDDVTRREQYWDFLKNTGFRRALLVHADREIDRSAMMDRLESLHVSSRLVTSAPHSSITTSQTVQFGDQWTGTALQINHPLTKAALMSLMATFPETARVSELLDQCIRTAAVQPEECGRAKQQILRAWSMNLLQLYATPPEVCARPGRRPEICAIARHQAANGSRELTNLRHEVVPIDPPFDQIVPLFDGVRTRDQIADVFLSNDALGLTKKLVGQPGSGKNVALHSIEQLLDRFVKESLVVR